LLFPFPDNLGDHAGLQCVLVQLCLDTDGALRWPTEHENSHARYLVDLGHANSSVSSKVWQMSLPSVPATTKKDEARGLECSDFIATRRRQALAALANRRLYHLYCGRGVGSVYCCACEGRLCIVGMPPESGEVLVFNHSSAIGQ